LPSLIERFFTLTTGAKSSEQAKTFFSFASLFFLLASYYLIKPLRSSQFLKEFDANLMPLFFLFIAVLSFGLTKVFNFFYDRMNTHRLIGYTYAVMMACKLIFLLTLPMGGKFATVFFYLWASVYFLLCNAVLWGSINALFHSESAERCFGFISIGATSGSIFGAVASEYLASSPLRGLTLLISAVFMGLALLFMLLALKASDTIKAAQKASPDTGKAKAPFWSDLAHLWQHRYVRGIATMVFALAVLNTVMEFQWSKTIDLQASQKQYLHDLKNLNQALNQASDKPIDALNPDGFALVRELKHLDKSEYLNKVKTFIALHHLNLAAPAIVGQYSRFRENLEAETRKLISGINKYQGIVGVLLLVFAARPLYRWVGVRWVLMSLPALFAVICVGMFFPIDLMTVVWMQTGTYALNYSLYRTSKELLYTQTDNEARFKLKPLIEGPIMRLGDVSASIFKLLLLGLLVLLMGLPEVRMDQVYLGSAMLIIVYWLYEAWYVGSRYEVLRKTEQESIQS
jgi:ATP/ADP translocase